MRRTLSGSTHGAVLLVAAALGACSFDFDQFAGSAGAAGSNGDGGSKSSTAGDGGSSVGPGSGGVGSGKGGAATASSTGGSGGSGGATSGSSGGNGGAATGGGNAGSGGLATAGTGGTGGSGGATGSMGGAAGAAMGGKAGTGGAGGSGGVGKADASDAPSKDAGTDVSRPVDAPPDVSFCSTVSGVIYAGHCYFRVAGAFAWDTAATSCTGGSHLVTITSAGEQGVAAGLLGGQDLWIGLRMPANAVAQKMESAFYWVTGETFTPGTSYTNWDVYSDADKEPNFTGPCVRMEYNQKWADGACTQAIAALCEHD